MKLRILKYLVFILIVVLGIYLMYLNIRVEKNDSNEEELIENNDIVVEENPIVYDNKTLDELAIQLDKSLNSTLSGKGYFIASYALDAGVDPYLATAIILEETGCKWECSALVKECNNVGGQVGYGCGRYSYFNSLDEGIIAFIDNLANNYINIGLTTPEQINTKYAESSSWAMQVNNYIESIKTQ